MSPLLTSFGGISIYPLGFTRGGLADSYFIATVATGSTSYGIGCDYRTDGTLVWSYYDQTSKYFWTTFSPSLTVGSTYTINGYSYASGQTGIRTDASGNVYIGVPDSVNSPNSPTVNKISSSGTRTWSRQLTGLGQPANVIDIDSSGNVYSIGTQGSSSLGTGANLGVAKYDSGGTIQFKNQYYLTSGTTYSSGESLKIAPNGLSVYCLGEVNVGTNPVPQTSNPCIFKINYLGALQWQRSLGYASGFAESITVDSAENVYVLQSTGSSVILWKFNSAGTYQWSRVITIASVASGTNLAVDQDDNIYGIFGPNATTLYVVKYNSSGTIQYQRSLTRTGGSLTLSAFSSNFSRGFTASRTNVTFTASDNNQAVLFKLPSDGSLTGTYTIGSLTYIYSASSLTEVAGTNTSSTIALSQVSNFTDSASTNALGTSTPTITTKAVP